MFGLAVSLGASAAPTTTAAEDDAAASARSQRGSGASSDPSGGDSRTMQILLDLQSSRAPLEGGDRVRAAPAPAPRPAAPATPAPPAAPSLNPFSRALENGRPAATRELRGPSVAVSNVADANGRPVSSEAAAAMRGERYGDAASRDAEQSLREKLGGQIPMPVALMSYIREHRTTVLVISLLSLALVGWVGARATQRRR